MATVKKEKRHILPLLSLVMMVMVSLLVFSQPTRAAKTEYYQHQDIRFQVPGGFSFLDKRQFNDADGDASVVMYADLKQGDVFTVTTLSPKQKITDPSEVKIQIMQYVRGIFDELKLKYDLSAIMKKVEAEKVNDHTVYNLSHSFQNDGLLILAVLVKNDKLHFFSYLKVRQADPKRGNGITNRVVRSVQ